MGKKRKQVWKEKAYKNFWYGLEAMIDKRIACLSCPKGEPQLKWGVDIGR